MKVTVGSTSNATKVILTTSAGAVAAQLVAEAAIAAANAAANTVRVSANSGATINKANGLNFVNTSSISISVEPGINGNANIIFTTGGASVNDAYSQANSAYAAANLRVFRSGDTMSGDLNVSANVLVTKNLHVGKNIAFVNTTNAVMAYTYYNSAANSIDTMFV